MNKPLPLSGPFSALLLGLLVLMWTGVAAAVEIGAILKSPGAYVHEKVEVELDRQEQLHKIESEWICSINKFGKILAIYDKS